MTPAVENLKKEILIPRVKVVKFHHAVAQFISLITRTRCYIQTLVDFLTTGTDNPDKYDLVKLLRVTKYLKGKPGMNNTLPVDLLSIINWYVDASCVINEY